MANIQLPLSNIINVSILPTPQNLTAPAINTAALFTKDQPSWIAIQSYAIYTNATDVATDFGSSSNTAKIATAFFAQQPNPLNTFGYLVIIPRSLTAVVPASVQIQDINYQAKTAGTTGNSITVAYTTGGTAGQEVVTVSSSAISVQIASGVSTAAQIAAAINAYGAASALVNPLLDGVPSNPQTGAVSATNLAGGSASGTEKVQDAIVRTLTTVFYFGILVDEEYHSTQPILRSLATYVQSLDKMLFYAASYTADVASGGLLDLIRQASAVNTRCLYYSDTVGIDTQCFAAAYCSRALSTNFSGSNTAQTMNLKQLAGITSDQTLTQTIYTQAQASGVDIYPSNAGIPGLLTSGANGWFDEIYNQFWLKFALQTAGFNYLATTNTKIPQTEQGMTGLKNVYRQVCQQAVVNGFAAPGSWNSADTFGPNGDLVRNIGDVGYYVYSLPITQQSPSDRNARIAPLVQIAIKAAGAVHKSSIIVNVNL